MIDLPDMTRGASLFGIAATSANFACLTKKTGCAARKVWGNNQMNPDKIIWFVKTECGA
jgi:hypothetical protein